MAKKSCHRERGSKIHQGFANSWNDLRRDTLATVASAMQTHPNFKLVITGHSLGGAIATIAAGELRSQQYHCDLYTYGSPRVGNAVYANFISNQQQLLGREFRVTNLDDPVPRLPPMLLGYRHTNVEYWISENNYDGVGVEDMKICHGLDSIGCNAGTSRFNLTAHNDYFQFVGPAWLSALSGNGVRSDAAAQSTSFATYDAQAVSSGVDMACG